MKEVDNKYVIVSSDIFLAELLISCNLYLGSDATCDLQRVTFSWFRPINQTGAVQQQVDFFFFSKMQILIKQNENIFGILGLPTSSLWSPFLSESFAWLLKLIFWYCEIFRCGARPQINGFQVELRAAEEAMTCSKFRDFGNSRLLPLNCLQSLLRLYPSEGSAFYGDIVMSNMRFFGSEIQQIAEPPWFNEDRQCVLSEQPAHFVSNKISASH